MANNIDEIKCSCSLNFPIVRSSRLNLLPGKQLIQLLRSWLSPADPSTNHIIARKAQHDGTAVWLFQGRIIAEWKSTGSLLWIHGKRAFPLLSLASDPLCTHIISAGSGKSVIWFVFPASPSYRGLLFASSSVIQDIMTECEAGSAEIGRAHV